MTLDSPQPSAHNLKPQVWQAALAGLLHDIGKFSQRAGITPSELLDKDPHTSFKYEHALASYDFVRKAVPVDWRPALSGVAYHHNPQSIRDRWVQLADWMSAAERVEDEDTQAPYLQTVFARVNGFDQPSFWPLASLDFTRQDALFPRSISRSGSKDTTRAEYGKLWQAFESDCRRRGLTPDTSLEPIAFLENLLAALQEFTWCIPSSYYKSVPDVSLYDHLRTTSALAACLAADERDDSWCQSVLEDLKTNRASQPAALLVGGDFSGIQDFIYTLTSSGAAKSLRARSFYLQILGELIAFDVLSDLGLPITNLIYAGGGKFNLLAPVGVENQLDPLAQSLADRLLHAHRGALGLTLAWESVRADEFVRFGQVYDRLGQSLGRHKRRPFSQASAAVLAQQIGAPLTSANDPLRVCAVTGDDWDVEQRETDGDFKTRFVWSLEHLGQDLPRATHLVLTPTRSSDSSRPHTWQEALSRFGFDPVIVTSTRSVPAVAAQDLVRIWRLDPARRADERELLANLRTSQLVLSDHPIPKRAPLDDRGNVITFDDLAEKQSTGIKRWGVLRMDMDNLGRLFRSGLGENASLSRIASLSFGLRVFFEGWLPQLVGDDLRDKIYIQYAGGDDLFVVGAWDALPEFALRIRASLRDFTSGNPAFTLSGGIAVVESKFPLYQAARLAAGAEDAAKSFRRTEGREKDAITFLEDTYDWESFARVKDHALELATWSRNRWVPKSLFQVILSLYWQAQRARQEARRAGKPTPLYGRWMWMAAYQLTRMAKSASEQAAPGIRTIQQSFLTPGDESREWGFAARWAHYLVRGGE